MSKPALITENVQVPRWSDATERYTEKLNLSKGTEVRWQHEAAEQDGYIDSSVCLTRSGFLVVVPNQCLQIYML